MASVVMVLAWAATASYAAIRTVLPAGGERIRLLPLVAGVLYDSEPGLTLRAWLNGRDVSSLFQPVGTRRSTLLRPVHRALEAFSELGLAQGVHQGSNTLLFRLIDENLVLRWGSMTIFQFDPAPLRVSFSIKERLPATTSGDGVQMVDVPARLHILGLDGTPSPNLSPSDPQSFAPRDTQRHFINSMSGRGDLYLEKGRYRLLATRGLRYSIASAEIDTSGDVNLVLERVVPTPGEVAADLHVHSIISGDSSIPLTMRAISFLATDMDLFVASDHNKITDFTGTLDSIPGARQRLVVVAGSEASYRNLGHWNVWPLEARHESLLADARQFVPREARPARLFDLMGTILSRPFPPSAGPSDRPEGLISLNHPLGILNLP
ncbi:MAG: hypothetical protein ACE5ID_06785 [Acidobacteriota bacterium]